MKDRGSHSDVWRSGFAISTTWASASACGQRWESGSTSSTARPRPKGDSSWISIQSVHVRPVQGLVEKAPGSGVRRGRVGSNPGSPLLCRMGQSPWGSFLHPQNEANTEPTRLWGEMRGCTQST